jgi:hypothetical protein
LSPRYAAATNILLTAAYPAAATRRLGLFAAGFTTVRCRLAAVGGAFKTIPFLLFCNVPMLGAIEWRRPSALTRLPARWLLSPGLHERRLPAGSLATCLPALAGIARSPGESRPRPSGWFSQWLAPASPVNWRPARPSLIDFEGVACREALHAQPVMHCLKASTST